jgi:hypothetical protein
VTIVTPPVGVANTPYAWRSITSGFLAGHRDALQRMVPDLDAAKLLQGLVRQAWKNAAGSGHHRSVAGVSRSSKLALCSAGANSQNLRPAYRFPTLKQLELVEAQDQ